VVGDVGEVAISLAVVQVHHLEHALRLLQEHVRLLVLVFLDEFVRDIRELEKQERDLVLVYLDLLVVEPMEGVVLFACAFRLRLVDGLPIWVSLLLLRLL
jgi:hypothetical protein